MAKAEAAVESRVNFLTQFAIWTMMAKECKSPRQVAGLLMSPGAMVNGMSLVPQEGAAWLSTRKPEIYGNYVAVPRYASRDQAEVKLGVDHRVLGEIELWGNRAAERIAALGDKVDDLVTEWESATTTLPVETAEVDEAKMEKRTERIKKSQVAKMLNLKQERFVIQDLNGDNQLTYGCVRAIPVEALGIDTLESRTPSVDFGADTNALDAASALRNSDFMRRVMPWASLAAMAATSIFAPVLAAATMVPTVLSCDPMHTSFDEDELDRRGADENLLNLVRNFNGANTIAVGLAVQVLNRAELMQYMKQLTEGRSSDVRDTWSNTVAREANKGIEVLKMAAELVESAYADLIAYHADMVNETGKSIISPAEAAIAGQTVSAFYTGLERRHGEWQAASGHDRVMKGLQSKK